MNIKECHVILDQSQRRISYVHLCENTKVDYFESKRLEKLYRRSNIVYHKRSLQSKKKIDQTKFHVKNRRFKKNN